MPKRARGRFTPWRYCVPVAALLTLSSCLIVVSTGPTTLVGGNIVFVAVDDHGAMVASLHITVVDLAGDWRLEGMTAHDGSFRCDVRSGVTRVRATVTAPRGYVVSRTEPWPREIDVSLNTSVRIEVRVNAAD
jgi:hypothetical protein